MRAEELQWRSASPAATFALGETLGTRLCGGMTVGLVGPLGAGKTIFTKGVAAGNAVSDAGQVTSPTFTLVHEYPGRLLMYHVDVYRLNSCAELLALGFNDMMRPDSAVVMEWADRVREVMPDETLWVELNVLGATERTVSLAASHEPALSCLHTLRSA
ncbi:MAG: tRNA (adenosine(37)-N6)-threonylcarbamoyltransferase complex ATPase subunit type 1 TsaE [Phycisphaerae bacterium]